MIVALCADCGAEIEVTHDCADEREAERALDDYLDEQREGEDG